jgi:hypothetical protein
MECSWQEILFKEAMLLAGSDEPALSQLNGWLDQVRARVA